MGVHSKLFVTVAEEKGNLAEVVGDVLATRAEATLRSRAWPIGQYVKWCRDGKVEPYPFTEKRCYEYLKHLADSKKAASRALCFVKAAKFAHFLFGAEGAQVAVQSQRAVGATWRSTVKAKIRYFGRSPFTVGQVLALRCARSPNIGKHLT